MKETTVSLDMMLAARDRRVRLQNKMLAKAGGNESCVVCLTLNIAGDVKRTAMTRMLFDRGVSEFNRLGFEVLDHCVIDEATGCEAYWLLDGDASEVKTALERIEDGFFGNSESSYKAARLFDFDVLTAAEVSDFEKQFINEDNAASFFETDDGSLKKAEKLSRGSQRKCLICERPAAECARSRNHGLDAIKQATHSLLADFCSEVLAGAAYGALLSELYTTPKPGLVDLNNSGAHSDMDVELFEKSAAALLPYFKDAALMGIGGCSMAKLRERGIAAEKTMFAATGGVNTHKGMVYSMGLLLAGMGHVLSAGPGRDAALSAQSLNHHGTAASSVESVPVHAAIRYAASLAAGDSDEMLAKSQQNPSTNGAFVLKNYGATGATGHAAAGFPDAVYCFERLMHYSESPGGSEAGALALACSMARLDDTNLLHRGGPEALEYVKERASNINAMPSYEDRIAALSELDTEMIEKNLSPGGSADMLALAYLLKSWNELSKDF